MDKMSKEQYANWKQQFLEEKRKAYEAEPGVYNLVKTKRLFWRILAVCWAVHFVLSTVASMQMQAEVNYLLVIVKTLFQIFWLYVFISPEGSWRINIMLYVSAGYNLVMGINIYQQSLQDILPQVFQELPILGLVFLMEMLIPFVLLGMAFYLTLPKSHRQQAERVQEIIKNLQEVFRNRMEHPDKERDQDQLNL